MVSWDNWANVPSFLSSCGPSNYQPSHSSPSPCNTQYLRLGPIHVNSPDHHPRWTTSPYKPVVRARLPSTIISEYLHLTMGCVPNFLPAPN
jgi:hypothetical protein